MLPSLLAVVGLLAYYLLFLVCASGSIVAGILAAAFAHRGEETKFNQAFTACAGLVTLTLILLAFLPTVLLYHLTVVP